MHFFPLFVSTQFKERTRNGSGVHGTYTGARVCNWCVIASVLPPGTDVCRERRKDTYYVSRGGESRNGLSGVLWSHSPAPKRRSSVNVKKVKLGIM